MEIVFLILKIIGIVLLAVIGLLLVLLLLVVFFPVSYRLTASYEETLTAKVKVHWLFHLISVTLDYGEKGKKCILRFLGIPLMDFLNPRPKKEKTKKRKPKREKTKKEKPKGKRTEKEKSASDTSALKRSVQEAADKKDSETTKEDAATEEQAKTEHVNTEEPRTEETAKRKLSELWKKLLRFPARLKQVIINILQKCKEIWDKGIDLKEKLEKWIEVLCRERTKTAIGKAKNQIIGLLKHIMPRKWNAYVNFGFDDPALTGQILGYYWLLIGLWGEHFICVPDFENKKFSGNIDAKGHIQVFRLLYIAYQFMFDKDLVYLRKISSEIDS
ncbi:MAG: DUF2953 domain-containing protein [Lachnospiraceae bacterium]